MLFLHFRDMPHSRSYSEVQQPQPMYTSYQRRASGSDTMANVNGIHSNKSVVCANFLSFSFISVFIFIFCVLIVGSDV